MRNRSDQILDQWDADQEDQNNLAMASTIDMHMGQMFPNRKAAQDLAQRMAGVNTAGNFLRDLGAARLGTTQAARMGRVDPAEMLREKLVGSMTNRLGQVGQEGGPGSMSDVFNEFNPAMSLMGGQPYEPRQDPMAFMKDRGAFSKALAMIFAQNGQQVDPTAINRTADAFFDQKSPQQQAGGPQSIGDAAQALKSSSENPLFSALGIMPGSSAQDIESVIQRRMAPDSGSPLSPDDLRKLVDYAKNKRAVDPEWGKNIGPEGMFAHKNLSELLNLAPGKDPMEAIRAVQDRNKQQRTGNSQRFQENPNSLMDYLRLMWGP
jgi:hypothetical protein